jgi:hypothetical protein
MGSLVAVLSILLVCSVTLNFLYMHDNERRHNHR